MEERLKVLIDSYIKDKAELDALDKVVKSTNAKIKELMEELEFTSYPEENPIVTLSVQNRESLDENKMILKLKQYAPDTDCIKTKEYIDMDVLENEIYHGQLSQEALNGLESCKSVKQVKVLNISKKRGKK